MSRAVGVEVAGPEESEQLVKRQTTVVAEKRSPSLGNLDLLTAEIRRDHAYLGPVVTRPVQSADE
jgi:hypothetical protein